MSRPSHPCFMTDSMDRFEVITIITHKQPAYKGLLKLISMISKPQMTDEYLNTQSLPLHATCIGNLCFVSTQRNSNFILIEMYVYISTSYLLAMPIYVHPEMMMAFITIIIESILHFRNCQLAFSVAERELDIPALLDIRDMESSEKLDKRSILTYLSQFYHKFAKDSSPAAPVPRSRPSLAPSKSAELKSRPTLDSISQQPGDRKGNKLPPSDATSQTASSHSLPSTLNYPGDCGSAAPEKKPATRLSNKEDCSNKITRLEIIGLQDKTKSLGQQNIAPVDPNIAAIKHLVFDTKDDSSESTSPEMTGLTNRESDSGVDQSSDSSSPSSSRLSSVSPSFNKMNTINEISDKKNDLNSRGVRKAAANLIIKPKRSHIITNNRINANQSNKFSQGKKSINKSFQEAIIKFNSLSMQTDELSSLTPSILTLSPSSLGLGEGKQLRSQSCQTEPESHQRLALVSQQSQTETKHPSLPTINQGPPKQEQEQSASQAVTPRPRGADSVSRAWPRTIWREDKRDISSGQRGPTYYKVKSNEKSSTFRDSSNSCFSDLGYP